MRRSLPCLLWLCCLALVATPSYASPQVPVTETWGDLLSRPPLRAGADWVRLGVEAKQGAPRSTVLVYALYEGATASSSPTRSGARLGSLEVCELAARHEHLELTERLRRHPKDALHVLYVTELQVPARGSARFELKAGARVVARVTLAARRPESPSNPWFVVRGLREVAEDLKSSLDDSAELLRVSATRATARWPGDEALLWETPRELVPLARPLPRATPTKPELGVRLLPSGALELSLERGLGNLDERLLARVWIRGRPVDLRSKELQVEARGGLLRKLERRARVRLQLDLEALRADEQDRVELQLLYAPRGLRYESRRCESLHAIARGRPAISRRFVLREGRAAARPELKGVLQRLPSWKESRSHPCVRLLRDD
jgi:hypothetical protein